jgi:ATP-dependent protease HslVU (ClpYQ) peptidase subunit
MSLLVAYKKGDTVYMATDTRVITSDTKRNELCESNYKIQKMENGMLVGMTAEQIERQTLFAYPEIFTLDKNGELTRKHIVKEIIPRLHAVLEDEGLLMVEKGEYPYMKAKIFLAHKDVLYEICSTFVIIRYENYQAVGRACEYAAATLANTKETDDVNERLIKALDIAAKHCPLVGAPYLLIDTKSQKYQLVKGDK